MVQIVLESLFENGLISRLLYRKAAELQVQIERKVAKENNITIICIVSSTCVVFCMYEINLLETNDTLFHQLVIKTYVTFIDEIDPFTTDTNTGQSGLSELVS